MVGSLPRSRFLDVTQRSSKITLGGGSVAWHPKNGWHADYMVEALYDTNVWEITRMVGGSLRYKRLKNKTHWVYLSFNLSFNVFSTKVLAAYIFFFFFFGGGAQFYVVIRAMRSTICMAKAVLLSLVDPEHFSRPGNRTRDHAPSSEVLLRLSISCIGVFAVVSINRLFDNLEYGRKNYSVLLCTNSAKRIEFCLQKSVRTLWIKALSKWTLDCNKLQVQATRGQQANFKINA